MLIETPEYKSAPDREVVKPQLRMVDPQSAYRFDAVMQEQNITRAAHTLGMSQPAVSNAVPRLKVMFNDELCALWPAYSADGARLSAVWLGTPGAAAGPKRIASAPGFEPLSSERVFHLCVSSPPDNILTSVIFNKVAEIAPNIHLVFKSALNQNTGTSATLSGNRIRNRLVKSSVALSLPAFRYLKTKWSWSPVATIRVFPGR